MNRLQLIAPLAECQLKYRFDAPSTTYTATAEPEGISLFTPLHYEAGYAYPLVVWLHGAGQDSSQVAKVVPHISPRNYVAVAPRGTVSCHGTQDDFEGFSWRQDEEHVERAESRILEAIEQARGRRSVNLNRVFIGGEGCGGTMAYRMAMDYPQRFRGVLSLGGAFPTGSTPLARYHQARSLPIFMATARDSTSYDELDVCRDLRLMHSAGMSVTLRQYPGVDSLNEDVLSVIDGWIMEILASDPAAAVVTH